MTNSESFQYNLNVNNNHSENLKLSENFRRIKHEYNIKMHSPSTNITTSNTFLKSFTPSVKTKYDGK